MFQNPIAWLGLAAIAVPVLVHLLGRRRARRLRFPALRFVPISPLPPVRRDRLTDPALLAVRIAAIAAAAVALVQPLWLTPSRAADVDATLARAIVVDTSASMAGVDRARREAADLAASATTSRTIDSASPYAAVPGALAWLGTQSGRAELVIVSDFQTDAIERADLASVPAETGIRLVAVPLAANTSGAAPAVAPLRLVVAPAEQGRADAALAAARQLHGEWKGRADRPTAIVFPAAPERAALLRAAQPVDRPWMFEAIASIARDATLAGAARIAPSPGPGDATLTVVTRAADGQPLVLGARGQVDGADRLLLFLNADPGGVASAALIVAAGIAAGSAPATDADPVVRSADELRSWERPPAAGVRPVTDPAGRSDGRWFWAAALALLGLETLMRRRPRASAIPAAVAPHEEHERVA